MSAFKRQVDHLVRAYRAVLIFTGGLSKEGRHEIDETLAAIPTLTSSYLHDVRDLTEQKLRELDHLLGFNAPFDYYVTLAEEAIANPSDLFFIPKAYIETKLFRRFERVWAGWDRFPPHTRFGFDMRNELPFTGRTIEWRLLEAALFEDMAMLWNESLAATCEAKGETAEGRIPYKKFQVLKRSAARAVYALLEGYLNGLAADLEWTTNLSTYSPAQREMILERSDDGKVRYKQLRDKILQYPKIALAVEHPPIQESMQDFALILQKEREWRDAFMHPTPRPDQGRPMLREQTFFEIQSEELGELIDAAISLIRRVDTALDGKFGRVELWIADRGEGGRFADKVFF